ncbi:MAG: single-stranded DNA-binding protein [Bacteroidia bacterium]|nr:single-stranded DNA-binding protein [Bacteroidia bacterium]
MINKVILIGNLGRDPEVRRLESGAVVAKFSLATNESYRDKNNEWQTQTEWHDIVLWRNLAERAERDLKKGKLVYVEGKLTHRKWQDKDGNDRYTTEVVANTFRLLEKRESSSGYSTGFPSEEPISNQTATVASPTTANKDLESMPEDDLPF